MFVFIAYFYQANFLFIPLQFVFALLASIFLIAIFVSDFLYQEIPFGMTMFPAIMLGLLAFGSGLMDWKNMLQGAIIAAGFFLIQYMISKGKWIGLGDVALGVFIGVILGGQKTLLALALAYMIAAFISLILLATKKFDRKNSSSLWNLFISFNFCVDALWRKNNYLVFEIFIFVT
jgi:prepilin signal peptidase PulO-like enzyme (type II secretory pathway)